VARIVGVDLPRDKRIEIALTYIYGIGRSLSSKILKEAGIDVNIRVKELNEEQVSTIRKVLEKTCKVEGDLHKEVTMNIKRLMEIGSYRGLRHRRNLPVRGQRTHTNARAHKGPRANIMRKKR